MNDFSSQIKEKYNYELYKFKEVFFIVFCDEDGCEPEWSSSAIKGFCVTICFLARRNDFENCINECLKLLKDD